MPEGFPIALEVRMTAMTAVEGIEAVALGVREAASRLLNGSTPRTPNIRR